AYQILDSNLAAWSRAALGRPVSQAEFLRSPHLQDQIFHHRFGHYVKKYGAHGAARAWLGGEGAARRGGGAPTASAARPPPTPPSSSARWAGDASGALGSDPQGLTPGHTDLIACDSILDSAVIRILLAMPLKDQALKRLRKKAKKGHRGWP